MKIIIMTMALVVFGSVGLGIRLYTNGMAMKKTSKAIVANLAAFIPLLVMSFAIMGPQFVYAATQAAQTGDMSKGLGLLGAGLSTGLAAVGAGVGTGSVGAAALGAVSEDPKMLGKTLIFVGLAEGIAIYGIVITIMILSRI